MNILTFDVEDWFHLLDVETTNSPSCWDSFEYRLENNLDKIIEILVSKNIKASFFILGWVAMKYPNLIKKIHSLGFEMGTHSYAHQLIYQQNPFSFKEDLRRSIELISDLTGNPVKYYRAPGFSLNIETLWVFEIITELGIEIDCSVFSANRTHGGLPEINCFTPSVIKYRGVQIKEFPINVKKMLNKRFVFSGGGYFRLLPYWLISSLIMQFDYNMTYFHPRDFDPEQSMIIGLSIVKKFKSYYGLKTSFKKFEKLTDDFKFTDIKTASHTIDWNTVPIINL